MQNVESLHDYTTAYDEQARGSEKSIYTTIIEYVIHNQDLLRASFIIQLKMYRGLLLVLAVGLISVLAADLYSDEFDHLDVDLILSTDEHREAYYNCFMDTGPCESLTGGVYFKANFPEALVTKCARCTEKQKVMVEKIVLWYSQNQAEKWNKLIAKLLEDAKKMKLGA